MARTALPKPVVRPTKANRPDLYQSAGRGAPGVRSVAGDAPATVPARSGNVTTWPQPARHTVGAENAARIHRACQVIRKPIGDLKAALPDVSAALLATSDEISRAVIQQRAAVSEFVTVSTKGEAEVSRIATMFAAREERLDPTPAGIPGETTQQAIQERAKKIRGDLHSDYLHRYEQGKAKLAATIGAAVVAKLKAAAVAVERAELRAGLDTSTPDASLVAAVTRTVMAEPTLRRPDKARELLDKAMRLEDAALLLALESLIPVLQAVIENGVPALTKNWQHRAGDSSSAMSNAVATVNVLRGLRDARLSQAAIGRAREILTALEWLALKTVGIDAADPACVANLRSVLSPARGAALDRSKLTPDTGKSGGRWLTRYIRSTAPLSWPPLLTPQPMALRDDPKGPNASR